MRAELDLWRPRHRRLEVTPTKQGVAAALEDVAGEWSADLALYAGDSDDDHMIVSASRRRFLVVAVRGGTPWTLHNPEPVEGTIDDFVYGGQPSGPYPARELVTLDDAVAAAAYFVETKELRPTGNWVEQA